jgi:hypothetical protein
MHISKDIGFEHNATWCLEAGTVVSESITEEFTAIQQLVKTCFHGNEYAHIHQSTLKPSRPEVGANVHEIL